MSLTTDTAASSALTVADAKLVKRSTNALFDGLVATPPLKDKGEVVTTVCSLLNRILADKLDACYAVASQARVKTLTEAHVQEVAGGESSASLSKVRFFTNKAIEQAIASRTGMKSTQKFKTQLEALVTARFVDALAVAVENMTKSKRKTLQNSDFADLVGQAAASSARPVAKKRKVASERKEETPVLPNLHDWHTRPQRNRVKRPLTEEEMKMLAQMDSDEENDPDYEPSESGSETDDDDDDSDDDPHDDEDADY